MAYFEAYAPGTVINGRYVVERTLGVGGISVVYLCTDKKLGKRPTAVKVLFDEVSEEILQRFRKEIVYSYDILHPNVVRTYDLMEVPGLTAISMEYVDGGDLRGLLKAEEKLELGDWLDLMTQICSGLRAIHQAEIVHRDLKPGNVLLSRDGVAKIADFSIAWKDNATKITRHGGVVGSLSHLCPSYIETGKLDSRTDIYSFGAIAYELLVGKPPFEDMALVAFLMNKEKNLFPPVESERADVPSEVADFVHKALERDPEKRHQSVDEMLEALSRIKGEGQRFTSQLVSAVERASVPTPHLHQQWQKSTQRGHGFSPSALSFVLMFLIVVMGGFVMRVERKALKEKKEQQQVALKAREKYESEEEQRIRYQELLAIEKERREALEASKQEESVKLKSYEELLKRAHEEKRALVDSRQEEVARLKELERLLEKELQQLKLAVANGKEIETKKLKKIQKQVAEERQRQKDLLEQRLREEREREEQRQKAAALKSAEKVITPPKVTDEYDVKAVILYNLFKHVTWPNNHAGTTTELNLCIVGPNPFSDRVQKGLTRGHAGKRIQIKQFPTSTKAGTLTKCHIAFIRGKQSPHLIAALHAANVLTATEGGSQSIVRLFLTNDKVKFRVDSSASQATRLKISKQLLALAAK